MMMMSMITHSLPLCDDNDCVNLWMEKQLLDSRTLLQGTVSRLERVHTLLLLRLQEVLSASLLLLDPSTPRLRSPLNSPLVVEEEPQGKTPSKKEEEEKERWMADEREKKKTEEELLHQEVHLVDLWLASHLLSWAWPLEEEEQEQPQVLHQPLPQVLQCSVQLHCPLPSLDLFRLPRSLLPSLQRPILRPQLPTIPFHLLLESVSHTTILLRRLRLLRRLHLVARTLFLLCLVPLTVDPLDLSLLSLKASRPTTSSPSQTNSSPHARR